MPQDPGYHNGIIHIALSVCEDLQEFPLWRNKVLQFLINECGLEEGSMRLHAEKPVMIGIPKTWADLFKMAPAVVTGEPIPDEGQDGDDGDKPMGSWSQAQSYTSTDPRLGSQPKAAGHGPWRGSRPRGSGH